MKTTVFRDFYFSAAHRLEIPGHKCSVMHGHNYKVRVECAGPVDDDTGMLVDFHHIKEVVHPIIDKLDHTCLNEVEMLPHTTAESIAAMIAIYAKRHLPEVSKVTVWETDKCGATVEFKP